MKSALIKVAAVAAFTVLAGCQDLKPLQADVDNLKQQVSRLTADLAAAKSSADAANAAAQSASSTRAVRRALPTRRWPPRKLRSPAATRPTRRSTGCSVARSRSKSFLSKKVFALMKRRALRGVFFDPGHLPARMDSMKGMYCVLIALAGPLAEATPQNYLFTDSTELTRIEALLSRPDIAGVQIGYSWKSLESSRDVYDFSQIEHDLAFVAKLHRKLFIQIQDRFFEVGHRNVPAYLLEDPRFGGGLSAAGRQSWRNEPEGRGWIAQQWNPEVRKRFQKLLGALARRFDGRVAGVNLPETAAGVDIERDRTGFTCEGYFDAELENIAFARKAFAKVARGALRKLLAVRMER
jgi:outer membrane murein-binding lipoprotein Lpp